MKTKNTFLQIAILLIGLSLTFSACKKDKDDDSSNPSGSTSQALVIKSAGGSVKTNGTFDLDAVLIDKDGKETTVSGVVWTFSDGSATIDNNGVIKGGSSAGAGFVTASVVVNNVTYTAKIPFSIVEGGKKGDTKGSTELQEFVVAPAAIIWSTEDPFKTLELEWVYLGQGSLTGTPAFTSSNPNIASIDANGKITFKAAGETKISVLANGSGGKTFSQTIPVLVIGKPTVPLPVTRIDIQPQVEKMFLDGSKTFTAKAYNGNNEEVTGLSFAWEIEDADPDTIDGVIIKGANVDQTGKVTPNSPSVVKVKATAKGVSGSATVIIYPDGYYFINPITISMQPGQSKTMTASYYEFNRTTFEAESKPLPTSTRWQTLSSLWSIPGLPSIGNLSGSGANASFTTDPFSGIGIETIFVYDINKKDKISPGVCLITSGF